MRNKNLERVKDQGGWTSGAQRMVTEPRLDDIPEVGKHSRRFDGTCADILE